MLSRKMLAAALVLAGGAGALAAELVGVRGSDTRFTTAVESTAGGTPVKLVLTGVALRQKFLFNVYAIGSYVREGAGVRTAEELAAADCPKCLHLAMLRDVAGKDVAEAFFTSIRANYAEPAFQTELAALYDLLKEDAAHKGDHIWLTHVPGVGLHVDFAGKPFTIRNPAFSRAVWEIYLGRNNLGEPVKRGLVSRL